MYFDDLDLSKILDAPTSEIQRTAPNEQLISLVEAQTGFVLPESYLEFLRFQNGGECGLVILVPALNDYFDVWFFCSLGGSAAGDVGNPDSPRVWTEEWGCPAIGIPFAYTVTGENYFFDYRECGQDGEPQVVHIDPDLDFEITVVARNFEEFVWALQYEDEAINPDIDD